MKRIIFLFLSFLFIIVLFSSCVSTEVENTNDTRQTIEVKIVNKCDWKIHIQLKEDNGRGNFEFDLKKEPYFITLYDDTSYTISLKGVYDYTSKYYKIKTNGKKYWVFNWSIYDNNYTLSRYDE